MWAPFQKPPPHVSPSTFCKHSLSSTTVTAGCNKSAKIYRNSEKQIHLSHVLSLNILGTFSYINLKIVRDLGRIPLPNATWMIPGLQPCGDSLPVSSTHTFWYLWDNGGIIQIKTTTRYHVSIFSFNLSREELVWYLPILGICGLCLNRPGPAPMVSLPPFLGVPIFRSPSLTHRWRCPAGCHRLGPQWRSWLRKCKQIPYP